MLGKALWLSCQICSYCSTPVIGPLILIFQRFGGDAAPGNTNSAAQDTQEGMPTIIEQVKLGLAETAKSFMLDMWLARHTPEKVMPLLLKVIKHMEEEFADAMANGGGLYAVGYCFGGKYLLLLGGVGGSQLAEAIPTEKPNNDRHESVPQFPIIRAGAMAHGMFSWVVLLMFVLRWSLLSLPAQYSMAYNV